MAVDICLSDMRFLNGATAARPSKIIAAASRGKGVGFLCAFACPMWWGPRYPSLAVCLGSTARLAEIEILSNFDRLANGGGTP